MNAEIIAKALRGCRAGAGWVAHCPAHDDRKPSLSIRDTKSGIVLVWCHAGCEQARVIEALRSRGLWTDKRPRSYCLCTSFFARCRKAAGSGNRWRGGGSRSSHMAVGDSGAWNAARALSPREV